MSKESEVIESDHMNNMVSICEEALVQDIEELAKIARSQKPMLMHSIIPISQTEDTGVCHSAGMNLSGMPDLVLFGFDEDRSRQLIEYTYSVIQKAPIRSDFYEFMAPLGQTLYLVDVDRSSIYCQCLSPVIWKLIDYGVAIGEIKEGRSLVKQIVVPDQNGRYPWQDNCSISLRGIPYLGFTNGTNFNGS